MSKITRKQTTHLLSRLVERDILSGTYCASEVTVGIGTGHEFRIDYMKFVPKNQTTSGIEKGDFYCYEVKSCLDDYKSGNGLNFIGDKNYIVCPMSLYKGLHLDTGGTLGVYVPIPKDNPCTSESLYYEYQNPTSLTFNEDKWKLHCISPCSIKFDRKYSVQELLFCMLRSGMGYKDIAMEF